MNIIDNIVSWIRKGYPEGIPPTDYPPLFALLTPVLDDSQITDVVLALALNRDDGEPTTRDNVAEAIKNVTQTHPSQDEINQVAARLAAAGWPLDNHLAERS
ncbi:MAG: DUF3349 domain-containing protein [Gordonia sp. (in: high G+C Gram-positive bacteria)]|uniref:DUF3349 domain-containing protein n=1 Tax=Gordonia sp. (in: high G+C Gram-positive bacteria) TaxID=84139 RepID=UPI0039E44BB2